MDKQVVKLSSGTRNNNPRKIRNASLAESYEKQGYEVVRRGYPNNAFVAIYKGSNPHNQLERTVGGNLCRKRFEFYARKRRRRKNTTKRWQVFGNAVARRNS